MNRSDVSRSTTHADRPILIAILSAIAAGLLVGPSQAQTGGRSASTQESLPAATAAALARRYPGWRLISFADGCDRDFSGAVVRGDFDGDAAPDHLVKISRGDLGAIVVVRATGRVHTLEEMDRSQLLRTGISSLREGGRTQVMIGTCESSAAVYSFEHERFTQEPIPDTSGSGGN